MESKDQSPFSIHLLAHSLKTTGRWQTSNARNSKPRQCGRDTHPACQFLSSQGESEFKPVSYASLRRCNSDLCFQFSMRQQIVKDAPPTVTRATSLSDVVQSHDAAPISFSSGRSVAANTPALGAGYRRCKSCRPDQFPCDFEVTATWLASNEFMRVQFPQIAPISMMS